MEQASLETITISVNKMWGLITAVFIFFMQSGFALVEAGSVRAKNCQNLLIKNVFDACLGAIGFYFFGYALSNGDLWKGFIGTSHFAGTGLDDGGVNHHLRWVFNFAFSATSATIVSGSLAERTYLETYLIYSFISCSFIYPVVSAWHWGGGWLKELGFIDFAGSGIVHMVGGASGCIGAYLLGPRYDIFGTFKKKEEE